MISLAYLVTVLFAIVAVSQGEEKSAEGSKGVSEKFWGSGFSNYWAQASQSASFFTGSSLYGTGFYDRWSSQYSMGASMYSAAYLGVPYSPTFWLKVADGHSTSRRALALAADELVRRSDESVTCTNPKGNTHEFVKSDCLKAADKLAEKSLSTATCGKCTLSLVTNESRIAPKGIPVSALQSTAEGMMKACASQSSHRHSTRAETSASSKVKDNEKIAMILSSSEASTSC